MSCWQARWITPSAAAAAARRVSRSSIVARHSAGPAPPRPPRRPPSGRARSLHGQRPCAPAGRQSRSSQTLPWRTPAWGHLLGPAPSFRPWPHDGHEHHPSHDANCCHFFPTVGASAASRPAARSPCRGWLRTDSRGPRAARDSPRSAPWRARARACSRPRTRSNRAAPGRPLTRKGGQCRSLPRAQRRGRGRHGSGRARPRHRAARKGPGKGGGTAQPPCPALRCK
jgi:hypothetical protein